LYGATFSTIAIQKQNDKCTDTIKTILTNTNSIASEIIIGNISTGFRSISIEIINIGDDDARDISYVISIKGGLLNRININNTGSLPLISSGEKSIITLSFPIGFGDIIIDISVEKSVVKTLSGKIFLFFLTLEPELTIDFEIVAEGFNSPIFLTNAGDGSKRLFVVDQIGKIYVIENNLVSDQPFLDISDKIVDLDVTYDERGLLGLTFHPSYEENGKFYVYYSSPKSGQNINHETILAEYHVSDDPNKADPNSEKIILKIEQPEANHNGGQLLFGPDGYLYLGLGDGGGAGDQHGTIGNGQDTYTLLGSIVRLDVDSAEPYAIPEDNPFANNGGRKEIFSWGLRNPWRFSYDPIDDIFYVPDVGQDEWEEINLMNGPGNYGWRILEATHPYDIELADELGIDVDSLEKPIHEYSHNLGHSITGGYVYRGSENPQLYGKYIFGDWSSSFVLPRGTIFYLEEIRPGNWQRSDLTGNSFNRFILSFGEDEDNELYVLSKTTLGPTGSTGDVRKIIIE